MRRASGPGRLRDREVLLARPIEIRTAGFWRRGVAFGLDAAFVAAATAVLGFVTGVVSPQAWPERAGNWFDYLVDLWNAQPWTLLGPLVLFATLLVAYDAVTLAALGTSAGRRMLGLEVFDRRGGHPGPGRALVRALLRAVSIAVFGLGVLWAAAERERRAWHDLVAGTWVGRRSRDS